MLTSQRKQLILEKLEAEGQVQSTALSLFFSVSEDTIRRDLRELAAEGRLQRVFTAVHCQHLQRLRLLPSVSPSKWMQKNAWHGEARSSFHRGRW